jgi:hypothetical protein
MSEYLGWEMAELFSGKTKDELDELAGSFKLENCVVREELNEILRKDAEKGERRNGHVVSSVQIVTNGHA